MLKRSLLPNVCVELRGHRIQCGRRPYDSLLPTPAPALCQAASPRPFKRFVKLVSQLHPANQLVQPGKHRRGPGGREAADIGNICFH